HAAHPVVRGTPDVVGEAGRQVEVVSVADGRRAAVLAGEGHLVAVALDLQLAVAGGADRGFGGGVFHRLAATGQRRQHGSGQRNGDQRTQDRDGVGSGGHCGLEVSPARTGIAANANARPPGTPVAQDAGQEMCLRMRQDAGDGDSSARRPAFSRVPSARKYVRSSRQAGKRASTAAQNAGEWSWCSRWHSSWTSTYSNADGRASTSARSSATVPSGASDPHCERIGLNRNRRGARGRPSTCSRSR